MAKALDYAEKTLGVHSVHDAAKSHRGTLDKILTDLSAAKDKRRELELNIADQEQEVIIEERTKHPDMPVTRWDRHIKEAYRGNDALRQMRERHNAMTGDIEGLEFDKQIVETDIKICLARMNELGGYFHYLAEVKSAQSLEKYSGLSPSSEEGKPE